MQFLKIKKRLFFYKFILLKVFHISLNEFITMINGSFLQLIPPLRKEQMLIS